MNKLTEVAALSINLSKTMVYSIEHQVLYFLTKSLSPFVTAPYREEDKKLLSALRNKVIDLHRKDASNIAQGIYPLDVLFADSPIMHLKRLPNIFFDALKIARRRKMNATKDIEVSEQNAPEYFKRNFHFQTDGYFSLDSARRYEHQVEILFSGTASPMRRMLIAEIKKRLKNKKKKLRILEIGAGTGVASIDFFKGLPIKKFVVTDLSSQYLALAEEKFQKKDIDDGSVEFVSCAGEKLPFKDQSFDLVFSVFLFHELPKKVRTQVLQESYRVLRPDGIMGICDSIQKDDDKILNKFLEQFPKDYHEPFYRSYTLWDCSKELQITGFKDINSEHYLLSKTWTCRR